MEDHALTIGSRPTRLAWGLLLLAAVANASGYVMGLWRSPIWFDEIVHCYTIFAITLFLAFHLYGRVYTGADAYGVALTLALAAMGVAIGALWEVMEWTYDQWFAPGNAILGKWDTVTDLGYDTLGALVAAAVATAVIRRRTSR